MSGEEGGRIDGEEDLAAPDWRVKGPENKPTQKEREECEATHVPLRDRCLHCIMGRGRSHHHVTKQRSEDQARRPTIAMNYYFMKMKSVVNAQNNDRIIRNLYRRERRQTSEHHDQCCVEDAVKGHIASNGFIENAVMLIRGIIRTIKNQIESSTQEPLSEESLILPWLVEHAGCILSRCHEGRDGKTPFE